MVAHEKILMDTDARFGVWFEKLEDTGFKAGLMAKCMKPSKALSPTSQT